MNGYQIITDFGCNLPEHIAARYQIEIIPTHLHIEGENTILSNEIDIFDFYRKLRDKKMIRTSAISMQVFKDYFRKILNDGEDLIFIGMSSGLSSTFHSACLAAEELLQEYPDRRIRCVDSRSGCGGEGLLVYHAALKREEGADIEENYAYLLDIAGRLQSWFTVDDLFFLKRGGRLTCATAIVGSLLMIKPILTASEEGKLFAWGKARGRKGAVEELLNRFTELAEDPEDSVAFISHSDCMEEAVNFDMKLRAKWDVKDTIITDITPAFGAHCGPGAVAVFFIGRKDGQTKETVDQTTGSENIETEKTTAE